MMKYSLEDLKKLACKRYLEHKYTDGNVNSNVHHINAVAFIEWVEREEKNRDIHMSTFLEEIQNCEEIAEELWQGERESIIKNQEG